MKTKKCSRCKKTVPLEDFPVSRGKVRSNCKPCQRIYLKDHYEKNRQYYIDKQARRRKERQDWFKRFKRGLKCSRCPETHEACIEFHHKDPSHKEMNLSQAVNAGRSAEWILSEIEKCETLCSNCHRKLHHAEKTGPWYTGSRIRKT